MKSIYPSPETVAAVLLFLIALAFIAAIIRLAFHVLQLFGLV